MVAPSESTNGKRGSSTEGAPGPQPGAPRTAFDDTPADPLAPLMAHLKELIEYAGFYAAVRIDKLRVSLAQGLFYAVLGFVGLLAGATAVIAAVVMLLDGLATGLGVLLGGRVWLGQLIVGFVLLAGGGAGAWYFIRRQLGALRGRIREKYEQRKQDERAAFGTDIARRAEAERAAQRRVG
jgi:hypothetical protein